MRTTNIYTYNRRKQSLQQINRNQNKSSVEKNKTKLDVKISKQYISYSTYLTQSISVFVTHSKDLKKEIRVKKA